MVGCAFVLVAFPLESAQWSGNASFGDAWRAIFDATTSRIDALAQATPLDVAGTLAHEGLTRDELARDPRYAAANAGAWATLAFAWLAGGMYLLARRVIRWQVPAALIATVVVATLLFWLVDPDRNPSPLVELATGALVFGAFFVATDPATGSATPRGRLVFGAGVALLALAIRRWGTYPDGLAFAVLAMNAAVPLIDRATRAKGDVE